MEKQKLNIDRTEHFLKTFLLSQALLEIVEDFSYPNDFQRQMKLDTKNFNEQCRVFAGKLEKQCQDFTKLFGSDVKQSQNFIDCTQAILDKINEFSMKVEVE